jgi:hypothetical protein
MKEWEEKLARQGDSLALLEQALDRLEQARPEDLPHLIAGPLSSHHELYKLQVGGKIRLRPILCRGPADKRRELTFLVPAYERNWKFDPPDAVKRAQRRLNEIKADPEKRRRYDRGGEDAE